METGPAPQPLQSTTQTANEPQQRQRRKQPNDDTHSKPTGISEKGSAASAAASLGWANKKSPEPWRPEKSASASTAAFMAKDFKLAPTWGPTSSSYGAKAALLASQANRHTDVVASHSANPGLSAANLAFKSGQNTARSSRSNTLDHQKSLLAAKGAVTGRRRSKSTPIPKDTYPDEANAAANALSAATRAHQPLRSPTISDEGGAVPFTTMNRQMFTSRPPVKPEVDEQKRADVLHASAVAMAKKMYSQQQKMFDARKVHEDATSPHDRSDVLSTISDDGQPAQLTTLQDAAYKQAQARLAKIQQENSQKRDYQEYYGAKPTGHRFSVRGKLRRRSSSDGAVIEDRKRSQHIRQQMSMFSNKLTEVDEQKRQRDQEALLAAAQRNVHLRLKGMDEKISAETGMVRPSTLTQWELKAHAAAQARSIERAGQTHDKVDIGAGKFMSQEEIDAIAAHRVQPVLDEINEKAEKEHARQTELRLELERKKEQAEVQKAREKEIQEITKKLKDQEKFELKEKRAEEKQEMKVRKEEEKKQAKAKKEEEKATKPGLIRLIRPEKGRSADENGEDQDEPEATDHTVAINSSGQPVSVPTQKSTTGPPSNEGEDWKEDEPTSPQPRSPTGRVKIWLKSRFSKTSKSPDEKLDKDKSAGKAFVGGAALTGMEGNESSASLDNPSIRAVAIAGRKPNSGRAVSEDRSLQTGYADQEVSPLSSESEDEVFRDEARDQLGTSLTPPRPTRDVPATKSQSPARDSKFHEII